MIQSTCKSIDHGILRPMDDLSQDPGSPPASAVPPTAHPPPASTTARAPGRPARSAEQRAEADARYQQILEVQKALPARAREVRMAIFEARPGTGHKGHHLPLKTILFEQWKEAGLADEGALASWLEENLGPGLYLVETRDAHNKRIDKIPNFTIATDEEANMAYDDDYDENEDVMIVPRHGRRRRRRRRRYTEDVPYEVDDEEEDVIEARSNIADMLTEQARLQAKERETTTRSTTDTMSLIMQMQHSQNEARERLVRDERAREERRSEERRQEMRLEEERRREERRTEEDRRRDERKLEEERRREERKAEEERRREERLRDENRSQSRMQTTLAAVTAAIPVILKMIEGKPNTLQEAVLAKVMAPPATDPNQTLLLKHILDKNQGEQSIQSMIGSIVEMQRATGSIMTEQMRGAMTTQAEMSQALTKRVLDMALNNPNVTEEDKGTLGQLMDIISGASGIINNLTGPGQQSQPVPMMPQPVAMIPGAPQPDQVSMQQVGPVQQQVPVMETPTGIRAVGACLMTIQAQAYQTQEQYQEILAFMVSEMPDEVRQAVAAGDEMTVLSLCAQTFEADPELKAWITAPNTVQWVRQFLSQLAPQIEQMYQQLVAAQPPPASTDQPPPGQEGDGFIEGNVVQGPVDEEVPPVSLADVTGEQVLETVPPDVDEEEGDPNDPV